MYTPSIHTLPLFKRFLRLHWPLIGLITTVACIGFAMLYSAAQGNFEPWAIKQIKRFILLLPMMMVIALIDMRFWIKTSFLIYISTLLLLILVEIAGHTAMGATRWVKLGFINIQPSEFMKISLVFAMARYFHEISLQQIFQPLYLIPPIVMIAIPAMLILKQPDLGTAGLLILLGGGILFVAGVHRRLFIIVLLLGITALPFAWQFLHEYQKQRVITFLNPENDPLGAGYNIIQSKIAIGSGGVSGKGFLKGTQSQLNFLPEHQTDFIFTMLAEETGFMGGFLVLVLYAAISMFGLVIALRCQNHFGRMMAAGITILFFLHVFINIAMVMGLVPVVGVPLPLLSYGGTILVTVMIGFGLLLNAHIYRDLQVGRNVDVMSW